VVSDRLRPFGVTIFAEMTALAERHQAINLSQGFPDFAGPPEIVDAAIAAMRAGENQYARSMGHPKLVAAIAAKQRRDYGLRPDPMTEVAVFSGATEGIAASFLGLVNPGDEVILFEPFYDSYPACASLAGATPRFCTLRFPDFALDAAELEAAVTSRTRMIVLNTPHNPTGKVFARDELEVVADLARRHDLLVLTDEVYEYLTFDGAEHVPFATLPGVGKRTLTLSSAGKTFSYTGWKIGWATGPRELVHAAWSAHQFLTFSVATPFQVAMARALDTLGETYFTRFRAEYLERRDFLVEALCDAGFRVAVPRGTYFVLADFTPIFDGDDRAFARHLIETCGVAAIPPSVFYRENEQEGRRLVRFAFCKRRETLEAAAERLGRLR
jgi:N-succinyldiaminopimelate aminotransferase